MSGPRWLTAAMVEAMHNEATAVFGGAAGLRDRGLLESALDRPRNLRACRPEAGVFDMAAVLCLRVCKNHAFLDGNKRTALLATAAFLFLNGWLLDPAQPDEVETMVGVAAGDIGPETLSAWLEASSGPV